MLVASIQYLCDFCGYRSEGVVIPYADGLFSGDPEDPIFVKHGWSNDNEIHLCPRCTSVHHAKPGDSAFYTNFIDYYVDPPVAD